MIIEVNNCESLRKKKREGITFFVPCFNEEKNITNTLSKIKSAANGLSIDYEVLAFDDCSKDSTVSLIRDFAAANVDVSITLIVNKKTIGLGCNYADGSYIAKYKYYMCIFGDYMEPAGTIRLILENLGKANVIIPFFNQKHRKMFRRLLSATFTSLVNILSGNSIHYYNWTVVHLTNNVMRWHSDSHGFGYQAEMITRLIDEGSTYIEVELKTSENFVNESNALNLRNIASVSYSLLQIFVRQLRRYLFKNYF